jgi:ATP-dependent 26S proteasome regulatory subunit
VREEIRKLKGDYDKSEDDLKALQSVGQIVGEVLKKLDEEKCKFESEKFFNLHQRFFLMQFYKFCQE